MQPTWTDRAPRAPEFRRTRTESQYVTMPDGVRIAVDVTLPVGASRALPAILRQTRYHRRLALSPPFDRPPFRQLLDQHFDAREYFVRRGYAWVDVCVRGSGASGGTRPTPWAEMERADGATLMNWITEQPWSNQRIGARGISYDGTAAEFLMWHGHPALRAVAPRFSLFDVYDDIAMPGGIHLAQFTQNWRRFNSALDRNRFDEAMSLVFGLSLNGRRQLAESPYRKRGDALAAAALQRPAPAMSLLNRFVGGVAPTADDEGLALLRKHLEERVDALDVHEAGRRMTFRDDVGLSDADPELTTDSFSPHVTIDQLPSSVPVFHYTGWYDGAYQRSAIKRFHTLDDPGQRLIIGPWEHGGRQDVSPWSEAREPAFDHEAELMRFFDAYLRDDEVAERAWTATPRVRYYTIGAERWQTSETWPPPHTMHRLFPAPNGRLGGQPSSEGRRTEFDSASSSGHASRWRSLLPTLSLTHYAGRPDPDRSFDTPRLSRSCELTGHPIVRLVASFDYEDPWLFVYLEDVAPNGTVHYITEGQLRGVHARTQTNAPESHRDIPFRTYLRGDATPTDPGQPIVFHLDLLPMSYLLRAGHALRLRVAGNDIDNFAQGPSGGLSIDLRNSWLDVPVASGALPFAQQLGKQPLRNA